MTLTKTAAKKNAQAMTADHLIRRYEELRHKHGKSLLLPDEIDEELQRLEWLLLEGYVYPGDAIETGERGPGVQRPGAHSQRS